MSNMLSSFAIQFESLEPITLNGYGGEAIHGLFFEILRNYSEKVFDLVHNGNRKAKPFSLSGILERKPKAEGKLLLDSGEDASFRVSILDEKLIPDVLAAFGKALNLRTEFYLTNSKMTLRNIIYQEGLSPWARSSFYPKLLEEAKPTDRIKLRFISPTSFRSKGRQCTIPQTPLIFGSLLDKWNSFSGIRFKDELINKLERIFPSQFELRTELVEFSNYKIIGFKGIVEYRLGKEFTKEEKRHINALADFAFFAGVGYKTTMGMGQTVRIK
jgi:CRISPR-associated endoribonuclease Cas6